MSFFYTFLQSHLYCHFQAMTVVIRDFKQFTVAEKHLEVLLGFVEEDIHDHTKQGTAFPLLKVSILSYFEGFSSCKRTNTVLINIVSE